VSRIARLHRPFFHRSLLILSPLALAISVAAAVTKYLFFDPWVTHHVQRISSPAFRGLMIAVSWPGYDSHPLVIVPVIAALLLLWHRRLETACLLLSAAGASLLGNLIKVVIARPRPTADLVRIYLEHPTQSFPSGHVLGYVATYGFLFYIVFLWMPRTWPRRLLLATLGALIGLVGLSRIYLGAHWTSDVLGGYCLGLVWLALMIEFYWRLKLRRLAAAVETRNVSTSM